MQTWAKTLKASLKQHEEVMMKQLYEFCSINSGSHHLQGLAHMHDALEKAFKPLVDTIETHALPPVSTVNIAGEEAHNPIGSLLYLRKRPHLKRRILLSGHMDTVFAEDHPFQSITEIKPGVLQGPGVTDMKGGLIVMLHGLLAFEETDVAKSVGWDVVINADEELGSPGSCEFFKQIRDQYQAALIFEPTPDSCQFARNRKGSGKFTLIAHGKAAHAGAAFYQGRNAIAYLAEALVAIQALNPNKRDVTFNIGKIAGGEALNIVPDLAGAKLDVRTVHPEDEAWVLKQVENIMTRLKRNGYTLTLHGGFGRPVKRVNPASKSLFNRIKALGKLNDIDFTWKDSGGCCDGNNLAEAGLAVIDRLGVCGSGTHTSEEFMMVDSLLERAHLTALLLVDLAEGGLEELK